MARKKRKRKKPSLPDVEDVLAGRVKPDAGGLIDLISKINPTGLTLPKREAEQRYAHKSALQSLLVQMCSDDLAVEPVEGQDNVVSLNHRGLNRSACHAILEDLDDESRSWVRMQLDLAQWPDEQEEDGTEKDEEDLPGPERNRKASEPHPEPPGSLLKGDPAELVERGLRALEEYDFDGARACLEAAFSKSDGDREPARGLLTLLVDHLGAFDEALGLAPRLSRNARKDAHVRLLMAVAAARAKKFQEALSWVEGLTGERAAEVDMAIADHAIDSGELKEARQRLEDAQRRGAHKIDIHAREKKIEALLSDERRPHEEALEKLLEQGKKQEAMDLARKILERWPGSPPARAVLKEGKDKERAQRARDLVARAEQELERSAFEEAARTAKKASRLGGDKDRIVTIIARAEGEMKRRAEEAQVSKVLELLAAENPPAGYLAYLKLEEALRARVRKHVPGKQLEWLEQMGAPAMSAKKRSRAVAAVAGLESSIDAMRGGRARDAMALLDEHAELLAAVAEAKRVVDEARERMEEERIEQARRAVSAAQEAIKDGDLQAAKDALGPVGADQLPDALRKEADEILVHIRTQEATRMLEKRFSTCLESGELMEAHETAKKLADSMEGEQKREWQDMVEEVRQKIRHKSCLRIIDKQSNPPLRVDELPHFLSGGQCELWLTDDGESIVHVSSLAGRLLIRLIDVSTWTVRAAVSMKTPTAMRRDLTAVVDKDSVWVADLKGQILKLDMRTWDMESWQHPGELIPSIERIEEVLPVPDSQFVWIGSWLDDGGCSTRVIDLRDMRVYRDLGDQDLTITHINCRPPRLLCKKQSGNPSLMDPRGVEVGSINLKGIGNILSVALHPSGNGLVVLAYEEESGPLKVVALNGEGEIRSSEWLEESCAEHMHTLATSLAEAACFIKFSIGMTERLAAFIPDGEGLRKTYDIETSLNNVMVQNAGADHVVLIYRGCDGLIVVRLSGEAPNIDTSLMEVDKVLPRFSGHLGFCKWMFSQSDEESYEKVAALQLRKDGRLEHYIEKVFKEHGQEPEMCARLAHDLGDVDIAQTRRVIERAVDMHPDNPELRLLHADVATKEQKWDEVIETLEAMDPAVLDPADRQHYSHILGMAKYATGFVEAAEGEWVVAAAEAEDEGGDFCNLDPYVELARAVITPLPPQGREMDVDEPLVYRLVIAIRMADEAMEKGEARRSLEAADCGAVWRAGEVQSLARLARAFLRVDPGGPMERFRMAMALALFVHCHYEPETMRRELLLPSEQLDREKLDDLRNEALGWLKIYDEGD